MRPVLREAALGPPPNLGGGWPRPARCGRHGEPPAPAGRGRAQAILAELFTKSVGDYLDQWFECDALKGLYGFEGIVGNFVGPTIRARPTCCCIMPSARPRAAAAPGGMPGAEWAPSPRRWRVRPRRAASTSKRKRPCARVLVEDGRASGVRLADGRTVKADIVAGNVNPRLLFLEMMDPALLPEDFVGRCVPGAAGRAASE